MSTNETKLESARQELRKLPAEWRTTYANYITLCNLREQFTEVFITEVRRKTDDPLKPGVNAASFVAAIENNMFGRIAAINTLVGVVEKLPEFAEASAAVGKAIGKVKAAEAPKKPGPSILGQSHIKQTLADLDARIAALKTPRPTATTPKARPVAAAAVAAAKPSAAAAAPAGLTRQEFNSLPPAARLKFCRDGGKFIDASDGKTFAAYLPPTLTRKAFNSLSPAKRLAHVQSGGKLID